MKLNLNIQNYQQKIPVQNKVQPIASHIKQNSLARNNNPIEPNIQMQFVK